MLVNAFANTSRTHSENYIVQHGGSFVNEYARTTASGDRYAGSAEDPNHLLGAFPCLFPYGLGGFEVQRPRRISYEAQAKWSMRYADRRFRKDFHFMFQVFGVIQKRQVCRSAVLQVQKKTFHDNEASFCRLTPEDLATASHEEAKRQHPSNPIIRSLKKHISAVRTNVIGTDESRINIRSYIWGMTMMKNPPSLWITINPTDTHDPIAQVLAGQEINLDSFDKTAGPDASHRALIIASDPYAAAKFFHFTIQVILEELMGITVLRPKRGHIVRNEGVFGVVEAYVGTVEAQGRGTLHLHMLLWLRGAPTVPVMKERLQSSEFRTRIAAYIDCNIRAHHDHLTEQSLATTPREKAVSYSRPLDPRTPHFNSQRSIIEAQLVRAVQIHKCGPGCLKVYKGRLLCKRRAPFALAQEAWIDSEGNWGPQRTYSLMNNWNPWLLLATRSNHDCKLITNGEGTKHISWYISSYATKRQQHSSNASALLAKSFAYHQKDRTHDSDLHSINKRLIQRCANSLSREQEFSAPEVVSYLSGFGDRYISHHFQTIHWYSVVTLLKHTFPFLQKQQYVKWLNSPSQLLICMIQDTADIKCGTQI